jgi:ankyrin repeat protein
VNLRSIAVYGAAVLLPLGGLWYAADQTASRLRGSGDAAAADGRGYALQAYTDQLESDLKLSGLEGRNATGATPLATAAAFGSRRTVQQQLDRGADNNALQPYNFTPLMWAAQVNPDAEVTRVLLLHGANPHAINASGRTPLMLACWARNEETARLLLAAGSDVRAAAYDGRTALIEAAENGEATLVQRLLNAGADPSVAAEDGTTPLMAAAGAGKPDNVQALLAAGASPTTRDAEGRTALDRARRVRRIPGDGRRLTIALLKQASAGPAEHASAAAE